MKRRIMKIRKNIPETSTLSGVAVMYLAASTEQTSVLDGTVPPDWVSWLACIGVALVGIGVFLLKVRQETNRRRKD